MGSKRPVLLFVLSIAAILPLSAVSLTFRSFDHGGFSRFVIEGDSPFAHSVVSTPAEIQVTLDHAAQLTTAPVPIRNSQLLEGFQHQIRDGHSVVTIRLRKPVRIRKNFVLESPFRVVFDLVPAPASQAAPPPPAATPVPRSTPPPPASEQAQPTPSATPQATPPAGEPSPSKRRAIETICLDPGHGGEDLGAVGKGKLLEKELTLKVSRKLRELIVSRLGLRVVMTRDRDADVSLNGRAGFANSQNAQIFLSIHFNSSRRTSARGSESYFVSLNATDDEAMELARKENQHNGGGEEAEAQSDELKMILWNMAQTEYIRESSRLAESIQTELNELLDTRNRGVKQAPFRVLMRTAMPAVLVETAFVSNEGEASKLRDEAFLDRVAAAIFNGLSRFITYYNSQIQ